MTDSRHAFQPGDFDLANELGSLLEWVRQGDGEVTLELRRHADVDAVVGSPPDSNELVLLRCSEVLRLLPGRRIVCKAWLGDQPVVAKFFLGSGAQRYQQRELAGCEVLLQAGVPTPEVFGRLTQRRQTPTRKDTESACGIIFEYLPEAQPLDDQRLKAQPELFDQLWGLLAQMNEAGIDHRDLHYGNLMLGEKSLWLIDGDAVSQKASGALSLPDSAECFVRLAAQSQSSLAADTLLSHWASYCERRRFPQNALSSVLLVRRYRRARRSRVIRFQAKTQRNCSAFASRRTVLGQALLDRSFLQECATSDRPETSEALSEAKSEDQVGRELLGWLDALPRLMDEVEGKDLVGRDQQTGPTHFEPMLAGPMHSSPLLKSGNTATVIRASFRGVALIIKRYNNKSFGHRVRRYLRPDRGLNSWVYAHTLGFTGIRSARAVALLRTRFAGPSYLVMQVVSGKELDPRHFQSSAMQQAFEPVSQELVFLFSQLATEGLVHGDTKASNFLWDAKASKLTLIDLDSMRMPASRRAVNNGHSRDRTRLLRNFATTPDLQRLMESLFGNAG